MFSGDSLYGIASLDITFTVCCEGWISWGPGVVTTENNIRDEVGMGFADVRNLYVDPCHWKSEGEEAPAVGGAVDDLVQAFARQKRFTASAPRDVTLAGFAGRYIELTLDNDLNFDVCDDNAVHSWIDVKGNSRHYQGPGQIEQFWIADVEGTRLVVEGSYFPQASLSDRAELARIIASITVDPR